MVRFKQLPLILATIVLASCSSHGGGSDGEGVVYTGGGLSGGNGSGSSSGGSTTTVSYTSYDSQGGYLDIDGGQYRTCTLTGNSTGGTVTMSDGTKADLTGSYVAMGGSTGNSGGSMSLAAASSVILIEGSFTVTFSSGITCHLVVDKDFIIEKDINSSGQTAVHVAGKAAKDYDSAGGGSGIVPGSADDPFSGTKWTIQKGSSNPNYYFEGGYVKNVIGGTTLGPYTVSKTDEGYKICWGFWSMTEPRYGYWQSLFYHFTIADANTSESEEYATTSRYDNVKIEIGRTIHMHDLYRISQ